MTGLFTASTSPQAIGTIALCHTEVSRPGSVLVRRGVVQHLVRLDMFLYGAEPSESGSAPVDFAVAPAAAPTWDGVCSHGRIQ
jgi:hypothetical protein